MAVYSKQPLFRIPNLNLMPVILNNLLSFMNLAKMIFNTPPNILTISSIEYMANENFWT